MSCTFDKDGTLIKFESGGIWFNASHYHEDRGDKSRDFPMGSLQSSCAEYEHRTGNRGTLALILEAYVAWMASPERAALLKANVAKERPSVTPQFFAENSVDIIFGDSVELTDGSTFEFTKEGVGEFTLGMHEDRVAKVTRGGFQIWPPPKDEPAKPKKATPKKVSATEAVLATPVKAKKAAPKAKPTNKPVKKKARA